MSDGSVTHWFNLLVAGQSAAAQPLWERYFHRLVGLAKARLQGRRAGPPTRRSAGGRHRPPLP